VLMMAGLENKPVVFLFSDTQLVMPSMLEDISTILNTGDIPNLYASEELDQIYTAMRGVCQEKGLATNKMVRFQQYLLRISQNLHVVLAMSPMGGAFRERLRLFPSLVNCCTLIWFTAWSREALFTVAMEALLDTDLPNVKKDSPEHRAICEQVAEMCVYLHQSVEKMSEKFQDELQRSNHVTPTSYLELINAFKKLLAKQQLSVVTNKRRFQVGLEKLVSTAVMVEEMGVALVELKPHLIETSKQVEESMVQIAADTKDADATRAIVEVEEAAASTKAQECQAIAEDAERDLAEALPALASAVASLKQLNVTDLTEMARYISPPLAVKQVLEAVCVMFQIKAKRVEDKDRPGKHVEDYWEPARKMLGDPRGLLNNLFKYDKDHIKESIITKIQKYINDPEFKPEIIAKKSVAATSLCMWVRAMNLYHHVAKNVEPKRQKYVAQLKEVEDKIATLQAGFEEQTQKKQDLATQVADTETRLDRANRLMGALGSERTRWEESVARLIEEEKNLVGDIVFATGAIAYQGAFTADYRTALNTMWQEKLGEIGLPHSIYEGGLSVNKILADPVQEREWILNGLPSDNHSIENGVFLQNSSRWPLMIDPQGQANKWVKHTERENNLDVVKLTDDDFLRTLENDIRFGKPVLIENVQTELDPALEPILLKQTFKQGASVVIRLGDQVIPYNSSFRLYLTTKLPNPSYSPETAVKVQLLNFAITPGGLEDQLLGIVVQKERPDLEAQKNEIVQNNARMKAELKAVEDKILQLLSESEGDILADETLIDTLSQSKTTSTDITAEVAKAEETEKMIDVTRSGYKPVAVRASCLFFVLNDMQLVDPMYQYSLQWFISLFGQSISDAPESTKLSERLYNLNDFFTYNLYTTVCRSLFEQHKLLFALLLALRIRQRAGNLDAALYRFLLVGSTSSSPRLPKPATAAGWLSDKMWLDINDLDQLGAFRGIAASFDSVEGLTIWRSYFDSNDPHLHALPEPFESSLDSFQRLLPLRCLRPDKVEDYVIEFVTKDLDARFVEPPTFDMALSYRDSNNVTPLVFVLSSGADPASALVKFAQDSRMGSKLFSISLGQGQGGPATKMIQDGAEHGHWVLLQNCHLALSWMSELERLVENLQGDPSSVHRDFRLWLTSMPSPKFPVSVLQNSVKMTNEPPRGLRANLIRSYKGYDDRFLDETCVKQTEYKKILYGLSVFHAIVVERKRYGALGFNIPYEFTTGDLDVCIRQLTLLLEKYEEIPFSVIRFLVGQINYGGRVTDDHDRVTLLTIIDDYVNDGCLEEGYSFTPDKSIQQLPANDQRSYLETIKQMPMTPSPEAFGFHPNAAISSRNAETTQLFSILLSLQPRQSSGGGISREDTIMQTAESLLESLPEQYDIQTIEGQYPTNYKESMNTVLVQECIRYNKLLSVIRASLINIIKAVKGIVIMSAELEQVSDALFNNTVPGLWAKSAYPSLKSLSTWFVDLRARCDFITQWVRDGPPKVFWISGLFFPQAFLTGTLQNFARRHVVPIDTVSFSFHVLDEHGLEGEPDAAPVDGCYVRGLYIEGCRWDWDHHVLADSRPKELYTAMPIIHLLPEANHKPQPGTYSCPVYRTLTRAGTLSTTGHSTNFMLMIDIPSSRKQAVWVKSGVAMFAALS
ncbi:dynein heavy chain, partial [Kipferlia bialata]